VDQAKFDTLVHYFCARCEDPSSLGATKLNKIMWYSDASAYLQLGKISTAKVLPRWALQTLSSDIPWRVRPLRFSHC
jgi:hypothetical protein